MCYQDPAKKVVTFTEQLHSKIINFLCFDRKVLFEELILTIFRLLNK